jgi:ribosomal protein L2
VRHRGGGHKRRIRMIDFHRMMPGVHTVDRIEHDPNRSAHIALITNEKTKKKSYIVAAEGMVEGDKIQSYRAGLPSELIRSMGGSVDPGMLAAKTALRGNCLPIRMVPLGTQIYNIGSTKDKGAVFCRSAGTFGIVVSKEETRKKCKEVVVRLQSGEIRRVDPEACATVGVASNPNYHFTQLGKAGRKRWLGIRPTVRGLAMNAKDHPHGGGRGKGKGNNIPQSPWGTPVCSEFLGNIAGIIADIEHRPKVVTRLVGSGTRTRTWSQIVLATKESGGTRPRLFDSILYYTREAAAYGVV